MTASPRLGFTYLTLSQATPETTSNEIAAYLEAGAGHFIFKDRDLSTPPGSPANGDCYLVKATGTGAWTGHDGDIAYYLNTAWVFIDMIEGFTAWVNDENKFLVATSSSTFQEFSTTTPPECLMFACSDETAAITTGTAKLTFRMPYAFTVSAVRASVTTAPTGSTILIDINESGTTILSTKLMIDATEKTSTTAATAAVISDASLADDAEMTVDFDQVGATIAGTGVKIYLIGTRT